MAKVKCSDYAKAISDLATIVASKDGVNGLDDVVAEIQATFPVLSREEIINAIVEANTWEARQVSELSQKITALRAAAKRESEPRRKAFIEKQIKEYERRLTEEDFGKKPKAEELPQSKELKELVYKRDLARQAVREAIEAHKPKSLWEKGFGVLGNAIPIRAGFDFSAVVIQNAFFRASHPVVTLKNVGKMLEAFASPIRTRDINAELINRQSAPLRLRAGIKLNAVEGVEGLTGKDELYMGRWVERLPVMRNFARAFPTFLNCMKADMFDLLSWSVSKTGEPTLADAKQIGLLVQEGTGVGVLQGKLGQKINMAIPAARLVYWAPRLVLSRFEIALGHPVLAGLLAPHPGKSFMENLKDPEVSWKVRKVLLKEYVRAAAGMAAIYAMYMVMGWEPPDTDWTSSDFLKVKKGNLRADPTGGLSSVWTLIGRLVTGTSTSATTGKVTNLRDWRAFASRDIEDVLVDFSTYKFNPIFAAFYHLLTGKKPFQTEDVTVTGELTDLLTPLAGSDIVTVMKEMDLPEALMLAVLIMSGERIQSYNTEKK